MPLPDLPIRALKRDEALSQGYHPFAGFFLPHEYPMLPNFIKDLEAANREYCIVRDLRYAKGIEVFAKNGTTDKIIAESPEATQTTEATQEALALGFHPPTERPVGALSEKRAAGNAKNWDDPATRSEGAKAWIEKGELETSEGESAIREGKEDLAGGANP